MEMELRQLTREDILSLVVLCNNTDQRYLGNRIPYPYTGKDGQAWFEFVHKNEGKNICYRLIWVEDKPVGCISVERQKDVLYQTGNLGYFLDKQYEGQGIMTKAVAMMCPLAFAQLGLRRISARVYAPNSKSRRVVKKNGFMLEGVLTQAITKNDKVYDLCIFGLLRNARL